MSDDWRQTKPFLHPQTCQQWEDHGPPNPYPTVYPVTFDEWLSMDAEEGSLDTHLDPRFETPTLNRRATESILASILGVGRESDARTARMTASYRGESDE